MSSALQAPDSRCAIKATAWLATVDWRHVAGKSSLWCEVLLLMGNTDESPVVGYRAAFRGGVPNFLFADDPPGTKESSDAQHSAGDFTTLGRFRGVI
jgi:hypothetical protein